MSMSATPVSINFPSRGSQDGSWLAVIARALAKCMTDLQNRMKEDADTMSRLQSKEKADKLTDAEQKALNNAKTDLKVAAPEYSMIVDAVKSVLATIGQGNITLAQGK